MHRHPQRDGRAGLVSATARVGLGGIWYQWMWLFSTPFYWLIAPIMRRLRVTTTGDFFRIRYGKSLEMLYALVALFTSPCRSCALAARAERSDLRRDRRRDSNARVCHRPFRIVLDVRDGRRPGRGSVYRLLAGPVDHRALSVLLVPAGLSKRRRPSGPRREKACPIVLLDHGPPGRKPEGDPWFVITMSILGLVGVVVQPHVMTATGSGKTETEARVGMVYGNFIKRLLTIARPSPA